MNDIIIGLTQKLMDINLRAEVDATIREILEKTYNGDEIAKAMNVWLEKDENHT